MSSSWARILYAVTMIAIIVGVDFAFFRDLPRQRLAVNIGIVLIFGAFYYKVFKS
jgi:hypothetical protein